ncbi:uncharacterized protein BX663DRAFT_528067 [Cokeromyces recurvatus]|uniref:uncharacterized protein n=1 Tax=Cokeromyces recurvatus TaxID=90255 RepID=UPI00221E84D9|nr:uncharacterized protein BX663DRAFT_528067 [Cokeromyces recurvatus]KAI7897507.1 hypothetical protein BX663DRAFT_528067 [Cokeromyces recurvatus]
MQTNIEIIDLEDVLPTTEEHVFCNNVARKIIFCIDISNEMNKELRASINTGIKDTNLYYSSRLETIQRFLKRFVKVNKILGNEYDKYAIILLSEKARWWLDFTTDQDEFTVAIDTLCGETTRKYEKLDTRSIFDEITKHVDLNDTSYFTQIILIYSRDQTMPTLFDINEKKYADIRNSPNFTFDVIFLHDGKLSTSIQAIYDAWGEFESNIVPGWYYEASLFLGKDKLSKALMQLVSHPLQRSNQENIEDEVV